MWDDCHAVGLLCFFFVDGVPMLFFLPHGLTYEYIISIFIFKCCKRICLSANKEITVIFVLLMKLT